MGGAGRLMVPFDWSALSSCSSLGKHLVCAWNERDAPAIQRRHCLWCGRLLFEVFDIKERGRTR